MQNESEGWGPRYDVRALWQTRPSGLAGGPVALGLSRAWHTWAIAALCSDSVPRVEVRVSKAGSWQSPVKRPLTVDQVDGEQVIGAPTNLTGWPLWSALTKLGNALNGVPDGARLELTAARDDADENNPDVGALRVTGKVHGARWLIDALSPSNTAAHLSDALDFTTSLFEQQRLTTHTEAERAALAIAFAEWGHVLGEDNVTRDGDVCTFRNLDLRGLVLLARPVFRTRFAGLWAMDGGADEEDEG